MAHYSPDPKNPTKSSNSRGSNLHVHFQNIRETAQAIKGTHISKLPDGCHLAEAVCHSAVTGAESVDVPRPNSGAECRAGDAKSAGFLLHMLENAESNAELKGLDVDSLVTEHVG
ncbi:large ribosomal subunit protein uL22-like [Molossus nigricans]